MVTENQVSWSVHVAWLPLSAISLQFSFASCTSFNLAFIPGFLSVMAASQYFLLSSGGFIWAFIPPLHPGSRSRMQSRRRCPKLEEMVFGGLYIGPNPNELMSTLVWRMR